MEKITQYLIQSTVHGSEVRAWEEDIMLPTYEIGEEEKNPIFLEKRVYQGSCGAVYPYPVVEKISDKKADKKYHALFIENEYIKVMVLPELGGRIHMAYDKVKKRHFVYYNQVVKPALVGLTGPWISGGIEFNWPQHHRPSTFLPTDFLIEENADGSKTIWCNEVERMFRTKGMQGFTLYPGKAYIEIKVKIYNRTSFPQTFLWWANPAVVVNDHYHSVFPPDVNAVFDHGKRDVSSFPIATGVYINKIILLVWISLNIRIFRFLHHIWLSSLNMILWVAMKKMFVGDFCTWPIIMFLRERNNGHGEMVISVRLGIVI